MSKMSTRMICYTAVLAALSAITNIFTVFLGGGALAVSFAYIPAFIGGAFLGPINGFLVGFTGDLLGCLINPQGAINPIILLSSGLMGLIPGMVFKYGKRPFEGKKRGIFIMTIISFILVFVFCITVNSFGLYVFYFAQKGKTFLAVLLLRLPKQSIIVAINFVVIMIIVYPLKRIFETKLLYSVSKDTE